MGKIVDSQDDRVITFHPRIQLLFKLLLVLFGAGVMLAALEGVAYIWERQQAKGQYAWELVASRRIKLINYYTPGAGYTLMKPGKHYEWRNISVDINSNGLRSPEFSEDKPEGAYRILNIGDSVAMGWGVEEKYTYGRQLESLLNLNSSANLRYEVINAGVPGWNLENELAYLQGVGLQLNPDLILLDITIVNDIYGKSALATTSRWPAPIEWIRANTYFWPFLSIQKDWVEARLEGKDKIDIIDPPKLPEAYFPLDPQNDKWLQIQNLLEEIGKTAGSQSIPLVVILFPLEYQVVDPSYTTLPQQILIDTSNQNGLPVLDLLSAYQKACREKPQTPCQIQDYYLFADVWMHPSALGHQITAQELTEFIP
jgi:lysophospholipase L1-like esterase